MGLFGTSRADELWWCTAVVLAFLFAGTLVLLTIDSRLLGGESVWAKPLKFEASLGLHFATLALALRLVRPDIAGGPLLWWIAVAAIAATAFEIGYIAVQAARQQSSHFNLSTPFYATMYVLMAAGAVVITLAAAAVGAAVALAPAANVSAPLRVGAVSGLLGGAILTLVTAFRMGGALDHHVGIEAAGAMRVPLTGWSLTVGDRRVPHFLATHMMQAVPVAALLLDRFAVPWFAVGGTIVVAAGWTALTLLAFGYANAGIPFVHWPVR